MGNDINVSKKIMEQVAEADSVQINNLLDTVCEEIDHEYPSETTSTSEPQSIRRHCRSSISNTKSQSGCHSRSASSNPTYSESDQSSHSRSTSQESYQLSAEPPMDASCFMCQREIGSGGSAKVFLAKNIHNNKHYALKEISRNGRKSRVNRILFQREKKVLKVMSHPNIVKYVESFENEMNHYIALEYCAGGTLMSRIHKNKGINETKAAYVIKSILEALKYMHRRNVVHRDLKCSNIVFDKAESDKPVIKVIDFGSAEFIKHPMRTDNIRCGTTHYMAPELNNPQRTKGDLFKADMWSLGVMCYVLVCGNFPFVGMSTHSTLMKASFADYEWPKNKKISQNCKDFVAKLLEVNVYKRMSAEAALSHEWIAFSENKYMDTEADNPELEDFDQLWNAVNNDHSN